MKWIGTGVLRIGKKDYGYGDTIPTKGLSPARIAQFKKLGYIGEVPVAGPDPEILRLKAQIAEQEATAKTVQEKGQKLAGEYKKLEADNADLEATAKAFQKIGQEFEADNAAMRAELEELKSPDLPGPTHSKTSVEGGAGPTSDKKGK